MERGVVVVDGLALWLLLLLISSVSVLEPESCVLLSSFSSSSSSSSSQESATGLDLGLWSGFWGSLVESWSWASVEAMSGFRVELISLLDGWRGLQD